MPLNFRTVLSDFRVIAPRHEGPQSRIVAWIADAHAQAEVTLRSPATEEQKEVVARKIRKLVQRFGAATDRIQSRGSSLDDFSHTDWAKMRIFPLLEDAAGARSGERMRFYSEVVNGVFERFYAEETTPPPVLMHVTCTGYVSPSGAQLLAAGKGWSAGTEVIHAYHMGCYASLPASRLAAGLLAAGKSRVDVVHTEICTLHLDPTQHMPEQLVVQTLFADGFIRYALTPADAFEGVGLELVATREEIIPETASEMGWMVSDHGMLMTLSRDVPDRIGAVLRPYLDRLAAEAGIRTGELLDKAVFAIHPGGPRIIDQISALLKLREAQVSHSNAVLRNHGNMSSATLPHIWKAVSEDHAIPGGTPVVALAFGPGLTVSGAVLCKISRV